MTTTHAPVKATVRCLAHYPLLIDGESVECTLPVGHAGDHEQHNRNEFGDVRIFPDQPECWDMPSLEVCPIHGAGCEAWA